MVSAAVLLPRARQHAAEPEPVLHDPLDGPARPQVCWRAVGLVDEVAAVVDEQAGGEVVFVYAHPVWSVQVGCPHSTEPRSLDVARPGHGESGIHMGGYSRP